MSQIQCVNYALSLNVGLSQEDVDTYFQANPPGESWDAGKTLSFSAFIITHIDDIAKSAFDVDMPQLREDAL